MVKVLAEAVLSTSLVGQDLHRFVLYVVLISALLLGKEGSSVTVRGYLPTHVRRCLPGSANSGWLPRRISRRSRSSRRH